MEPIFIDLEASGLINGFPIEVGWAAVGIRGQITVESHLIHHDAWLGDRDRWSNESGEVHKITREVLMANGKPPSEVAARMREVLKNKNVYSDNPKFDGFWAAQIFDQAKTDIPYEMRDISVAFASDIIDEMIYDRIERGLIKVHPHTHRAGDDARRWAEWWALCVHGEYSVEIVDSH